MINLKFFETHTASRYIDGTTVLVQELTADYAIFMAINGLSVNYQGGELEYTCRLYFKKEASAELKAAKKALKNASK